MRTLLPDPPPAELAALLERRKRLGQDGKDEVWEGVYHVVPAPDVAHARISQRLAVILDAPARLAKLEAAMGEFNLGSPEDYRVPDGGLLDPATSGIWLASVPLVVEILSPDDESWAKLAFYASHHVDEVLLLDPDARQVHWLGLTAAGRYEPIEHSCLIDLGATELTQRIDWP
jgi:Uma2 family endonuclease